MYKIYTLLLLLSASLFGYSSVQTLKFESGISIYGKIGYVDVILTQNFDTQTYTMKATTTSTGIVKILSNHRKDIFISEGRIQEGVYIPSKFTKQSIQKDENKTTSYIFDYEKNEVLKQVEHKKNTVHSRFNPISFRYEDELKVSHTKEDSITVLHPNDYLSLYLNMKSGNLKNGAVSYVDKKEKDTLLYKRPNLVEVQKNHGDDSYSIVVHPDKKSLFFKKIESIGVSFYGDAYIEKVYEDTKIIEKS